MNEYIEGKHEKGWNISYRLNFFPKSKKLNKNELHT